MFYENVNISFVFEAFLYIADVAMCGNALKTNEIVTFSKCINIHTYVIHLKSKLDVSRHVTCRSNVQLLKGLKIQYKNNTFHNQYISIRKQRSLHHHRGGGRSVAQLLQNVMKINRKLIFLDLIRAHTYQFEKR